MKKEMKYNLLNTKSNYTTPAIVVVEIEGEQVMQESGSEGNSGSGSGTEGEDDEYDFRD